MEYPVAGRDIPGPGQYELKSTLTVSANNVKIGKSARNDLIKGKIGPGPGAYELGKTFYHNFGPTFGKGKKNSYIPRSSTPGPGTYKNMSLIGTEGRKHSIYPKRPDTSAKYGQSSPGPAAYSFSYVKNSPSFSMGRGNLMKTQISIAPSPGNYNPNYALIRTKSPFWKMCKSTRNTSMSKKGGVDPGSYNLPSTFGAGPRISFHGKRAKEKIEEFPGPGAYNPNHKVILEKYPKIVLSTAPKIEKDFTTQKDVPGPGTYAMNSTLNGPKFGFGVGKKGTYNTNESIPGPGSYKIPCTIGQAETYQLANSKSKYSYV